MKYFYFNMSKKIHNRNAKNQRINRYIFIEPKGRIWTYNEADEIGSW